MGTRSTTRFIRKQGEELTQLVNIYQQYDGYISGVGYELAQFLLSKKVINGYNMNQEDGEYANGFDCLVAQYIAEFKKSIGGFYIATPENKQEYNYEVIFDDDIYYGTDLPFKNEGFSSDDLITIKVYDWNDKLIFEGTPSELLNFKEKWEEEE